MDKEKSFNFYTYSNTSRGVNKAQLFEKEGGEISLVPQESCLMNAQTLLALLRLPYSLARWSQKIVWAVTKVVRVRSGCSLNLGGNSNFERPGCNTKFVGRGATRS